MPREEFRDQVAAAMGKKGFQFDEEQEPGLYTTAAGNVGGENGEVHSGPRRVTAALSPQTAYIMTQLLQEA